MPVPEVVDQSELIERLKRQIADQDKQLLEKKYTIKDLGPVKPFPPQNGKNGKGWGALFIGTILWKVVPLNGSRTWGEVPAVFWMHLGGFGKRWIFLQKKPSWTQTCLFFQDTDAQNSELLADEERTHRQNIHGI